MRSRSRRPNLEVTTVAAQPVNRGIDAPAEGSVAIAIVDGDVTVSGWDQPRIEISGTLGGTARELDVTQDGDLTTIRVVEEEDAEPGPNGTELVVRMPQSGGLTVNATNSDVLVAGVGGALSLQTVSGDIEADVSGPLVEAEAVDGDIIVSSVGRLERAMLTTVAGEIEVTGALAQLTAATVSGDIELDVLESVRMDLDTTNGDIEVHATFDGAAELNAETINGDIELEVGEEGALNVDAATFSGRVETCFDGDRRSGAADAVAGGDETPNRQRDRRRRRGTSELVMTAADDAPRIRARSLNGDIEICSS